MRDLALVLSSLNLMGLAGVAWFVYSLVRGLQQRLAAITEIADAKEKFLRLRSTDLEERMAHYTRMVDQIQHMAAYLDAQRQAAIAELERAKAEKDSELTQLKTLQLEQIDLKRQSLQRIPELEKTLETTTIQLAQLVRLIVDADVLGESTALRQAVSSTPPFFSDSANKRDVIRTALSLYLSLMDAPIRTQEVESDVRDALRAGDVHHSH